jgi:uncharacterized protein YhhL (DUF1145 family)
VHIAIKRAGQAGGELMSLAKVGVIVLWLVLLTSFFLPDDSVGAQIGRIGFFVTAIAHVAEFFIYRRKLALAEGTMNDHFLQVLIFGLFHLKEVDAELAAKGLDD